MTKSLSKSEVFLTRLDMKRYLISSEIFNLLRDQSSSALTTKAGKTDSVLFFLRTKTRLHQLLKAWMDNMLVPDMLIWASSPTVITRDSTSQTTSVETDKTPNQSSSPTTLTKTTKQDHWSWEAFHTEQQHKLFKISLMVLVRFKKATSSSRSSMEEEPALRLLFSRMKLWPRMPNRLCTERRSKEDTSSCSINMMPSCRKSVILRLQQQQKAKATEHSSDENVGIWELYWKFGRLGMSYARRWGWKKDRIHLVFQRLWSN